jgi:KDO2-lipid IV(A) lauroyltransferase
LAGILRSAGLQVNRLHRLQVQSGALATKRPVRWYIAILYHLLRLVGRFPLRWLQGLGAAFGWLVWCVHATPRKRAQTSLSLAVTLNSAETRQKIARHALIESGKALLEVTKIWNGDLPAALTSVREVRGGELFAQALADGRGLIVAAPHLGCWELLNFWLCSRTPIAIVYRPPRQPALEPLLLKARGALAAEQVRAEGTGVRKLYKRLSAGGVVGILPDQQPRQGEGEFASFFGTPALTMVLLSRLAQRTGATVLFAFAERLPRGAGYCIHILPAPDGIAAQDLPTAVAALNAGVENCVRIAPEQYQWAYKRYSIRPPGDTQKVY